MITDKRPTICIEDSTIRTMTFEMNPDQVQEALFTWLRSLNIDLPSLNVKDYCFYFSKPNHIANFGVTLTYKEEIR